MNIRDNPYFKLVSGKAPSARKKQIGEILSGDSWFVILIDDILYLEYLSGEIAGKDKKIIINFSDYEGLKDNSLTVDHVLARHGAN